MNLTVKRIDELIEVVPHMLGFQPEESMVVFPLSGGLPTARVDLPQTAEQHEQIRESMLNAYLRHARPGSQVALICFTETGADAELASRRLAQAFTEHGVPVPLRLSVTATDWVDLENGTGGPRTTEAQSRIAAEFVMAGKVSPAQSRQELVDSLVGDRHGVADELPAAADHALANPPAAEHAWTVARIVRFEHNGQRLTDPEAARLLLAVQDIETRDAALMRMDVAGARQHQALWTDMTRRAPDEVRAPAAALLGFASWLGGDGARAWAALDQIPEGARDYRLAQLVAQVLEEVVPPSAWEAAAQSTVSSDGTSPPIDPPNLHRMLERPRNSGPPSPGHQGPRI